MTREDYGRIYEEKYERVANLLVGMGATWDLANDISQSAWARGWEHIHQLKNDEAIFMWICKIAINQLVNNRSRGIWSRVSPLDFEPETPTSKHLAKIDFDIIAELCVSDKERNLILMKLYGFSAREIAQNLGLSEKAVRIRFHRLVVSIRERLVERSQSRIVRNNVEAANIKGLDV